MSHDKSLNNTEATLAIGITNAYFTNLLRLQGKGEDTSDQDIRKKCMDEVFDFYVYAQNQVKKNQL